LSCVCPRRPHALGSAAHGHNAARACVRFRRYPLLLRIRRLDRENALSKFVQPEMFSKVALLKARAACTQCMWASPWLRSIDAVAGCPRDGVSDHIRQCREGAPVEA
jgi:hypothetical protein